MQENICNSCQNQNLTFVLECGFRICRDHFESINNGPRIFSCNFCRKKHSYTDCLKIVSNQITETDYHLELKIEEIAKRINEFNKIKQHKDYFRGQNYSNIRKSIDKKKEQILNGLKIDLENQYNRVLATLDCISSNIEDKINKNDTFNQLDYMEKTFKDILDKKEKIILSEKLSYLNDQTKVVDSFMIDLDSLKENIDKIKTLDFIEEKTIKSFDFNNSFGKFKIDNDCLSEIGISEIRPAPVEIPKAETQTKIEIHKPIEYLNDLKKINEFKAHCGKITALGLSNGDLVTGSSDGLVKIWNVKDGSCKKVLTGTGNRIKCLKVLPNDTIAVVSDFKRNDSFYNYSKDEITCTFSQIRIFDSVTGSCDKIIQSPSTICSIEYIENSRLVTGHDNGSIYFCDINTGEYFPKLENSHISSVVCLIKLNKNHLVSSSSDNTIKVWNLDQNKCTKTFNELSRSLVKLSDNQFLSGSQYGSIKLWDINMDKCLNQFESHSELIGLFVLDNDRFISCLADEFLNLWSVTKGKLEDKALTLNDYLRVNNCFFCNDKIFITYKDSIKIYSFNKS